LIRAFNIHIIEYYN